jgi:serine/threonine protein phosphatase PrpC
MKIMGVVMKKLIKFLTVTTIVFLFAGNMNAAESRAKTFQTGSFSSDPCWAKGQDRFLHLQPVGETGFFAAVVFDGHGQQGDFAAQIAADMFLPSFNECLAMSEDIPSIIQECFAQITALICARQDISGGTTASVVVYCPSGEVILGWVGDSTMVWTDGNGPAVHQTTNHNTTNVLERERAFRGGNQNQGTINFTRIKVSAFGSKASKQETEFTEPIARIGNGNGHGLAVSRSLGDKKHQKWGLSCIPEFLILPSTPKILILASDGLWDVMTKEAAIQLVRIVMKEQTRGGGQLNVQEISRRLVKEAEMIYRGVPQLSNDDITVTVIVNPNVKQAMASASRDDFSIERFGATEPDWQQRVLHFCEVCSYSEATLLLNNGLISLQELIELLLERYKQETILHFCHCKGDCIEERLGSILNTVLTVLSSGKRGEPFVMTIDCKCNYLQAYLTIIGLNLIGCKELRFVLPCCCEPCKVAFSNFSERLKEWEQKHRIQGIRILFGFCTDPKYKKSCYGGSVFHEIITGV